MVDIDWDSLGFEIKPAKKMFVSRYRNGKWDDGKIVDYGPFEIYPSACVLNYGQGIFEGMKAYRTKDNRVAMFRPHENARRLRNGCRRLCMPEIDEEFFVSSIVALLKENVEYIPPYGKGDLYIRPILFGSGQVLGVQPAEEYTFMIFMSPVGPYFKSGFKGINLEIRDDFHRAPLFGTGGIKAIGNYATSLYPKKVVAKNGFDEVLYLDAKVSTYVEEVGSANLFAYRDGIVSTPVLSGSILPGITRDSVLRLAVEYFNIPVMERDIRYTELFDADEVFCTGTAAIVTPILSVSYKGEKHTINDGKPGELTRKLYDTLRGIQLGEIEDRFGWFFEVKM